MANNKIFLIQERIVGVAEPQIHCYALSHFMAKKVMKAVVNKAVYKLQGKEDCTEPVPIYAFGQVSNVPRDGFLVFKHEDPNVVTLTIVKRDAGYWYGYYEKPVSTFEIVTVEKADEPSNSNASAKAVSAAAPARIAVTEQSSDSEKKEAEKRDRLYEEVTTSLGKLRIRKKIIDGRDEFHNEIVQKRLEMERRNKAQ